jgi:hypothetical protein
MPDESRQNPFRILHKALRHGHCRIVCLLGSQDFADDAEAAPLLSGLGRMIALSRGLLEARQEVLQPLLKAKARAVHDEAAAEDAGLAAALSELDSLIRALQVATPARRSIAGRALYRCYALFAAADMARMDAEETALLGVLHQSSSDKALRGIEADLFRWLAPEQLETLMQLMLPALGSAERCGVLAQLQRDLDPVLFAALHESTLRTLLAEGLAEESEIFVSAHDECDSSHDTSRTEAISPQPSNGLPQGRTP